MYIIVIPQEYALGLKKTTNTYVGIVFRVKRVSLIESF